MTDISIRKAFQLTSNEEIAFSDRFKAFYPTQLQTTKEERERERERERGRVEES